MTVLTLDRLTHRHPGAPRPAVDGLSLTVASGTVTALVGRSGCGKATALALGAGLARPDAGHVALDGRPVTDLAPERRGVVLMAQDPMLFPHMSVAENVGFGLRMRGTDRRTVAARVAERLAEVQLAGTGDRPPDQLSGGEAQRVALARAMIVEPRVLLLDEPLSRLDPELRAEMRDLVRTLQRRTGTTMVFVTHDREEAVAMGDRLALMREGRIVQEGRPEDLFERPVDAEAARFFGAVNVIGAVAAGGRLLSPLAGLAVAAPDGPLTLAIRPEAVRIGAADGEGWAGRVTGVDYRGGVSLVRLDAAGTTLVAAADPAAARVLAAGAAVRIAVPPERVWIIPGGAAAAGEGRAVAG